MTRFVLLLSWMLIGALFGGLPPTSHAQTPAPPPSDADTTAAMRVDMAPVEVTAAPFQIAEEATSFALSTRTRTEQEITTTPSLRLERITDGLPGLFVGSREHYATGDRLTIRGLGWRAQFGVRGVQVLLDGIPLTVADGQAMIGIVDPSFVRRLEVIRGPASTFWGNASGGVLAMSTTPGAEPSTLRLKQTNGSYGLTKTDVQVTPDVGPHRLSVYSSYLNQNGFRARSETSLSRTGLTGTIRLGEDRGIRTMAALQYMPKAENPSTLTADAAAEDPTQVRSASRTFQTGKTATQGQVGATYFDDVGLGTLRTTAYGIVRTLENPIPFGFIELDRRVAGARVTIEDRAEDGILDGLAWGVGAEGKLQRDDRREFGNDGGEPTSRTLDQREAIDNAGVFGRAALPIGRVRLSAGLRYDHLRYDVDDALGPNDDVRTVSALSPSIGASVAVGTAQVFANLASGLEAPTANELGNRPNNRTGFNPTLEPESIWSLETGVRGVVTSERLTYDIALFGMRVDDLLVPQEDANEQTFYRNVGRARHAGVEAALQWTATDRVHLRGSHTFVYAEFVDALATDGTTSLNGNRIPGVPPHAFSISAEWRGDWLWATGRVEGLSPYEVNSVNTAANDGYARVDLEVSHPGLDVGTVSLSPFVAVNNVFDTRYNDTVVNARGGRYYEPAAGRHYRFGLSLQVE